MHKVQKLLLFISLLLLSGCGGPSIAGTGKAGFMISLGVLGVALIISWAFSYFLPASLRPIGKDLRKQLMLLFPLSLILSYVIQTDSRVDSYNIYHRNIERYFANQMAALFTIPGLLLIALLLVILLPRHWGRYSLTILMGIYWLSAAELLALGIYFPSLDSSGYQGLAFATNPILSPWIAYGEYPVLGVSLVIAFVLLVIIATWKKRRL